MWVKMGAKAVGLMAGIAMVVGMAAGLAQAGPVGPDTWYEFAFGGPGSFATGCFPADPGGPGCTPSSGTPTVFADAPPWTFAVAGPGDLFLITDAFLRVDQFDVFDFGAFVLRTDAFSGVGSCGDDPIPCFNDPGVSNGVALFGLGLHSITIQQVAGVPGAGYFCWDDRGAGPGCGVQDQVPEPSSLILLGIGLTGIAGVSWRQRSRHTR